MNDWLVRHRDAAALAMTAVLMSGTWALVHSVGLTHPDLARAPEMVVALEELPPEAPAPAQVPAPVQAPAPVRTVAAPAPTAPVVPSAETAPAPVAAAVPMPIQTASPTSAPVVPAPGPPTPSAPLERAAPAPTAAPARSANVEAAYVAELRRYLDGIKRYPTGREAHQARPTGTVRVWIELERGGRLIDAGIETGSGAMLLDREALRTVRSGQYPPLPADAFAGEVSHRFAISLEYRLDSPA